MKPLLVYLILINAAAFLLMRADKQKARKKQWRIPERVLLGVCLLGGSLGGCLSMRLYRHKTKHAAFAIGIPVMLAVQIILLVLLLI